jgi:hypothetical protein
MLDERYELTTSIRDHSLAAEQRIDAVARLLEVDPELALHAVLLVTEDPAEESAILSVMGRQLNVIAAVHRFPTEWEVRDMQDIAYDAFCDP